MMGYSVKNKAENSNTPSRNNRKLEMRLDAKNQTQANKMEAVQGELPLKLLNVSCIIPQPQPTHRIQQ